MKKENYVVYIGEPCVDEYYAVQDKWPKEGDKFLSSFTKQVSGGMIANAASVMAGYGVPTYLLCRLFQDANYDFLIRDLAEYNIDSSQIIQLDKGRNTKCQIYLGDGERTINVVLGDEKPKVDYHSVLDFLKNAAFIYSSIQSLNMFNDPVGLLRELKQSDIKVFLDNESTSYTENWRDYVKECYAISVNEHAIQVFGEGKSEEEFEKEILDLGVTVLVETLGKDGCKIITKEERITVPACEVAVVDTTGAGDTFNSSFTYGLLNETNLKEAALFATKAAGRSITIQGGRSGVATIEEINQFH